MPHHDLAQISRPEIRQPEACLAKVLQQREAAAAPSFQLGGMRESCRGCLHVISGFRKVLIGCSQAAPKMTCDRHQDAAALQVVVHNLPWNCTWQNLKDAFAANTQNIERADVIIDSTGRSRWVNAATPPLQLDIFCLRPCAFLVCMPTCSP